MESSNRPAARLPELNAAEIDGNLRVLRRDGLNDATAHKFRVLLRIARALGSEKDDVDAIEQVVRLGIAGYGGDQRRREAVLIWFGLTRGSHGKDSTARLKLAWEHFGTGELSSYRTNEARRMHEFLKEYLFELYLTRPAGADLTTKGAGEAAPSPAAAPPATSRPAPVGRRWARHQATQVGAVAALVLIGGASAWGILHNQSSPAKSGVPSVARLSAEALRPLVGDHAPVPGTAGRVLGFGDPAPGGRTVYPYVGRTMVSSVPVFDSVVDVPGSVGDERDFLRVEATKALTKRRPAWHLHRSALLRAGSMAVLWLYLNNDGSSATNHCSTSVGQPVAQNTRVRLAPWQSADRRLHVFRAWVSADNAQPRWVTAAAAVVTTKPTTLRLDPMASWQYSKRSPYASSPALRSRAILEPAGMLVGSGSVGSCWQDRFVLALAFRQG